MQALLDRPSLLFILILVIILLFGYKRLPDAARGIGRSLRVFKAETESLRTDGSAPASDASATTGAPVAPPAPIEAAPAAPVTPAPAPAAPAPAAPASAPRYLVDPVTGEQILAQPVTPPADGAPRS